ncbi:MULTISPECIES: fumarylacetoacetate hydrolase family protein [unclassified Mycobacterium]|uniref:fumarylacetoacetate hydrolase family protein n=1 Tax=unclassified Mycobacterium TaxID=2642494 RepID=UPI0029C7AC84|nr:MULTISPECIES: fumarylacetoacetate hydrolase family protein [unclassified Mycobacterium]
MRLATTEDGRLGLVEGDELIELITEQPDDRGALHRLIESGADASALPRGRRHALRSVTLQTPLPMPGKILGAPVNYVDHQLEMHEPTTVAELGVFLKAPTSVLAPGGTVELPYTDKRTDQEAELAVVIGRRARHVRVEEALDYVFGYMCALDISVRSTEDRSTRKSFDTFTPLGPWITTADEVGDPTSLRMRGLVGDTVRQDVLTSDMIFSVTDLISYASSVMTLLPGDVIVTGTPAGVGPLVDGDHVVVDIDRVGRLEVNVSGANAVPYANRPGRRIRV